MFNSDSNDQGDRIIYKVEDIEIDIYEVDGFEKIIDVVKQDFKDYFKMFDRLKGDVEKYLYSGYINFIRLLTVLKLYNLKTSNRQSDKRFTNLFVFLKNTLSENNIFFSRIYGVK